MILRLNFAWKVSTAIAAADNLGQRPAGSVHYIKIGDGRFFHVIVAVGGAH